jgi:hypothetical protein
LSNFIISNGDKYEGDWFNDKMHGFGKFVTHDGIECDGEFKDNRFAGEIL